MMRVADRLADRLADLLIDGKRRKVVVYGSKTCWYYILDRRTGQAVHGMEERPVPQHAGGEGLGCACACRQAAGREFHRPQET